MDAGGETSASYLQSFILAILTYPSCQLLAQREIDRVVGSDRMPVLEDYEHLPYLKALVNEVHRFRPILPIGLPRINTEDINVRRTYSIPFHLTGDSHIIL
jgi:cytochrome P450